MQNTFNRCMFFQNLPHTFRVPLPVVGAWQRTGLPNLLYKKRKVLGLSKTATAQQLGVHREMVGHWERGQHEPRVKYGPAIIRFLGDDTWLADGSFADRLHRCRMIMGWTRDALARYLGCDAKSVRDWEGGMAPSPHRQAEIDARLVRAPEREVN
jgi:DNA-binding transcriptional regulator YiaG